MATRHKLDVSGDNVINSGDAHAIRTTIHLFCLFGFIKLGHYPCPNQNLPISKKMTMLKYILVPKYFLVNIYLQQFRVYIFMLRIYVNMCS